MTISGEAIEATRQTLRRAVLRETLVLELRTAGRDDTGRHRPFLVALDALVAFERADGGDVGRAGGVMRLRPAPVSGRPRPDHQGYGGSTGVRGDNMMTDDLYMVLFCTVMGGIIGAVVYLVMT